MPNGAPTNDANGPPAPLPKPHIPTVREVFCQAKHDLFGTKDVQETPTVSYTWMADQLGHFTLGFVLTLIVYWLAKTSGCPLSDRAWFLPALALGNFLIWVVKELFDYRAEVKRAREAGSTFPFNSGEIGQNIRAALFYIGAGAALAAATAFYPPWVAVATFLVLGAAALVVGFRWVRKKITFQQAGLPYLYRLANFPNSIPEDRRKGVVDFVEELVKPARRPQPGAPKRHLVITGKLNAGKSSLAVGVGTEFAFRLGIGRYTSLVKLIQSHERKKQKVPQAVPAGVPMNPEEQEFQDGRILWPWDRADLLIIDDVDDVIGITGRIKQASENGASLDDLISGLLGENAGKSAAAEAPLGAVIANVVRCHFDQIKQSPELKKSPTELIAAVLRDHFDDLIQKLKAIPRVVWVLSDAIDTPHFVDGVLKKLFGATDDSVCCAELAETVAAAGAGKGMEEADRPKVLSA